MKSGEKNTLHTGGVEQTIFFFFFFFCVRPTTPIHRSVVGLCPYQVSTQARDQKRVEKKMELEKEKKGELPVSLTKNRT